ncbi:MAG: ion transporter [Pirellulaceae bacterium]
MPAAISENVLIEQRRQTNRERRRLLHRISALLDVPMTVLSFVWLVLLIVDLTSGLNPFLDRLNLLIWAAFIVHFCLELAIAPDKFAYLRRNWLTAIALVLPAFRIVRALRAFRLLRLARVARSVTLLRVFTSLNRGMRTVQHRMRRRGLGYVVVLTLLFNFAGAAGMYQFENPRALREAGYPAETRGLASYAEALWWTAMMLTTMGSEYWPKTSEGRSLCLLLAVYSFAIFGYITATVASFIIQGDAKGADPQAPENTAAQNLAAVHEELAAIRQALAKA